MFRWVAMFVLFYDQFFSHSNSLYSTENTVSVLVDDLPLEYRLMRRAVVQTLSAMELSD